MSFDKLKNLFELAKLVNKDKIKDIKIEFWQDGDYTRSSEIVSSGLRKKF